MGRKKKNKAAQADLSAPEPGPALPEKQESRPKSSASLIPAEAAASSLEPLGASKVESSSAPSQPLLWPLLLLSLAVVLCFGAGLNGPFLFDDAPVITHNVNIQKQNLEGLTSLILGSPSRALTNLTFFYNYKWAGTSVTAPYGSTASYHAFNLLLHALNTILVFLLLRGILRSPYFQAQASPNERASEGAWPELVAGLAALIFAVHPAQTMAVIYIAQRYSLVAALTLLATLVLYQCSRFADEAGDRPRALGFLIAAFATSLLCYLSKENAATVGLLVVALELAFWGGARLGNALAFTVPFFFGIAARGMVINDPAFAFSASATLTLTLTLAAAAALWVLRDGGARWLPRGVPGAGVPKEDLETLGPAPSAEALRRATKLSPSAKLAAAALALAILVLGVLVAWTGSPKLSALYNLTMVLLGIALACRLYFNDSEGLAPLPSWLAFLALGGLLLLACSRGSLLDKLFPAPKSFSPEEPHYQYWLTQLRALLYYPKLMLLPWGYSIEHNYPMTRYDPRDYSVSMGGDEFMALIGHLMAWLLAWRLWSQARLVSYAIAWYYLSLLITSSIIPILDPVVEHRMYLPMALAAAGLVVVLSRLLAWIQSALHASPEGLRAEVQYRLLLREAPAFPLRGPTPTALTILVLGIAGILMILSQGRVAVWQSAEAVWVDATEKHPECARAWSSLGMVRLNEAAELGRKSGRESAYKLYVQAVGDISVALEIGAGHVEGWNNLGKGYLELDTDVPLERRASFDRLRQAELCFEEGIAYGLGIAQAFNVSPGPAVPLCYNNLALVYRRMALRYLPPISTRPSPPKAAALLRKGIDACREAKALNSNYMAARTNLGALLLELTGLEGDPETRAQLAQEASNELIEAWKSGLASPSTYAFIMATQVALGRGISVIEQLRKAAGTLELPRNLELYRDSILRNAREAHDRLRQLRDCVPGARLSRHEFEAVLDLYAEALRQNHPDSADIYRDMGEAQETMGAAKSAIESYQRSLQAAPSQEKLRERIAFLQARLPKDGP